LYDIDVNQTLTISEGQTFEIPFLEGEAFYNLCVGDSMHLSFDHPNFVSWSNGSLENQITITETGTYWANFTNAVNEVLMSNTVSFTFHEVQVPAYSTENVSCFGGADGSVQVDLFEGQSLIYQNEVLNEGLITNLPAGELVYEVVDSIGCSQEVTLELTEATEISSTGAIFIPNCDGNYELLFEGLHNGGTGELTVNWGEFNPDNVAPGAYLYYITDDLACTSTFGLELEAYDVLSVSGTISGVNDDGLGSIVLDVQGGVEPYDFEWTNTEGDTSAGDLEEGVYSVVVTDANGCESSTEFLITQISEQSDESIHLYPNPGTNGFVINNAAQTRLRVRDAQGRMIFETVILDKAVFIETNHWAQGIYFLELAGEQVYINKQWIKSE
ncbi:MAG: T9SS type A sorting domain-containing protein, partial [Flavobacteriales bacterium]|nr:T9SS type A sorting domain-containing protein [Flavobacteriales bacterium]